MIVEEDPKYKMDDETMQTILLKIMPPEYVKDMREQLAQGKHEDDYFSFEQALFDEINTRKMDEESRKKGGRINVLNSSGDDDKVKRNADGIEYEEVEIWSEEWQCNICGLAQKRSRSRSRSRGEDDEQDRPTKAPRDQEATKGDKGKGRGKRPGGPCWMCGGPHFQRECTNLGKRWTAVSHHHGVDVVATRKFSRTDPGTMELLASQTIQRKRQGKEQR